MTYKELMQILKEIQDDCSARVSCDGCKFYKIEGCALNHIPDQWNLEDLYTFPKLVVDTRQGLSIEEFGEALEILEGGADNEN
jgi:hypothetical protein